MKILPVLFTILLFSSVFSQSNYFQGKNLYCPSQNAEARDLFQRGIKVLHLNQKLDPKYLRTNQELFFQATKLDSTFCDAYFFTGYIARLEGDFEIATVFYYMADSLSTIPSFEFKQNLAFSSMAIGAVDLARKKYNEIKEFMPSSSEGFYGFALTSLVIGDFEEGLENINKAIRNNTNGNSDSMNDALYLKAILLTRNQKYREAIPYFEKTSKFKKEPNYYIHYSLALLKTAEQTKDEKMKIKAKKYYDKIDDKSMIPEELIPLFKF